MTSTNKPMKYSQECSGGMTLKGMAKYLITIIVLCLVPSVQTFATMVGTPSFSLGTPYVTEPLVVVAGYMSGQTLAITDATAGATICYTTDNSTPTTNGAGTCTHGTTYTTSISISASTIVKAVGSKSGSSDSSVIVGKYQIGIVIAEKDGTTQTNRPIKLPYTTEQGLIASGSCARPVVNGTPVSTGSWQDNIKTAWTGDGSRRFGIIGFWATIASGSSIVVTLQSGTCNTTGLTATQMANFKDPGGVSWGAQLKVTPAGLTAVTTDFKTMLAGSDPASNTFNDGKNDYWLNGPVMTCVLTREAYASGGTAHSQYDFGWTWNASTMATPVTGIDPNASNHPIAEICFYGDSATPTASGWVEAEMTLELPWYGRAQDQLENIEFLTGSTPSSKWAHNGARKLTDLTATSGSTAISSASASFTSADVGLPIAICGATTCTSFAGLDSWYTIASVTNGTTAALDRNYCPGGSGGCGTTNQIAFINLQAQGTRHSKTFFSGTALGNILIDYNFPYMEKAGAIANYDLSGDAYADPTSATTETGVAWSEWAAVGYGKCEIGGYACVPDMNADYAENQEGALAQREALTYLYNMSSFFSHDGTDVTTAAGLAAKGWQVYTGGGGAADVSAGMACTLKINGSTVNCPNAGGVGVYSQTGNVPVHGRWSATAGVGSQSSNFLFVPLFDSKAATLNLTCSSSGTCDPGSTTTLADAFGRIVSRHTDSAANYGAGNWASPVGELSNNAAGWSVGGCNHLEDYWTLAYQLTGKFYQLEEAQMWGAYCAASQNPDVHGIGGGASFFGFDNPNQNTPREYAWGLQSMANAYLLSPDGTPEKQYLLSVVNSNLAIMEGIRSITGTTLTPSDTGCSAATFSWDSTGSHANRWNYGRCAVASLCANTVGTCTTQAMPLYTLGTGSCTADATYLNQTNTGALVQNWQYNYVGMVFGAFRDLGLSQVQYLHSEWGKSLNERIGDSTYNPYLTGAYEDGTNDKLAGSTCPGTPPNSSTYPTPPYISTYAKLKAAMQTGIDTVGSFKENIPPSGYINIACGNHGYSAIGRASATYLEKYSINSSDPNCVGGTCKASNTRIFYQHEHPYYANTLNKCDTTVDPFVCVQAAASQTCTAPAPWNDQMIKYALAFQPAGSPSVTTGSVQTQNTIRKAGTVMQ